MEENKKLAIRKFSPGTKFVSLFGTKDIVNEKDVFKFDDCGDIYVLGKNEFKLIYNNKYWADIYID
jgi:hypothetical protein